MKQLAALTIITLALFLTGCSGSINVTSQPVERKDLIPIKNENIAIGFRNDNDYLYIAMVTNDRNKIMKVLTGGLEIWLEPSDSDNKIGIKYPERPDPSEIMKIREQRREMQEGGKDAPPPNFLQTQNTLSIINEDGMVLKEFPIDGKTYQAKVEMTRESFTYELRVPIGESQNVPDGLKAKSGETIAVEFITGNFMQDMQRRRDDGGMGMPHGEGDGRMGGRGPGGQGGPGGPGGMRPGNQGPLNYTFDVKLH